MAGNRNLSKNMELNHAHLIELANYKMPFGKYKNQYLVNLPESYYIWFRRTGFPSGKLGKYMHEMEEIKVNGLEDLIRKLIIR